MGVYLRALYAVSSLCQIPQRRRLFFFSILALGFLAILQPRTRTDRYAVYVASMKDDGDGLGDLSRLVGLICRIVHQTLDSQRMR